MLGLEEEEEAAGTSASCSSAWDHVAPGMCPAGPLTHR